MKQPLLSSLPSPSALSLSLFFFSRDEPNALQLSRIPRGMDWRRRRRGEGYKEVCVSEHTDMHVRVCLCAAMEMLVSNAEGTPITGLGGQHRRANNYMHRSKHKSTPVSRLTTAYYLLLLWRARLLNAIIGCLWPHLPLILSRMFSL